MKSVQNKIAPNDPPLTEEPVFIPACFKDPFDRLNRPLVEDYEEGRIGHEEIDGTLWDDFDRNTDVADERYSEENIFSGGSPRAPVV